MIGFIAVYLSVIGARPVIDRIRSPAVPVFFDVALRRFLRVSGMSGSGTVWLGPSSQSVIDSTAEDKSFILYVHTDDDLSVQNYLKELVVSSRHDATIGSAEIDLAYYI
jgi:hypothetical protein